MAEQFNGSTIAEDTMIPMRDGVQLATDIYHPTSDGVVTAERLPVLFHRTPYDKSSDRHRETAAYLARHGYVVAVQDVRGRYRSHGEFSKYQTEAVDGYDAIEWLAQQPYSKPVVGMWGTSYGAHTQADAAKLAPPSLKTIVLNMGGMSDGWDHKIRNHGAFELQQQVAWAFQQAAANAEDTATRVALERESVAAWIAAAPLRKGLNPLCLVPDYEDYLLQMAKNGSYGDWSGIGTNWIEYYGQTADIPMLHISGWYDSYAGGTVRNFTELSRRKRGPMFLIMGPWTHGGQSRTFSGEVEFGNDAVLEGFEREFHLRWFDHFLKGASNEIEQHQRVKIFVMGVGDGHEGEDGRIFHGGYWRTGDSWPLPGTNVQPYYFHRIGLLSQERPSNDQSSTTFTYNPAQPVPTIGGSFSGSNRSGLASPGPLDQREREGMLGSRPPYLPLGSRADVLVFQSDPLDQDLEIIGPVTATLFVSSSAPDTDFTVKLIDVYPPTPKYPTGFSMNLTDGIVRTRYRNSSDQPEMMQTGEIYEISLSLFPTANRFKSGHRIRVDVSSSNFPRFDVNPNTGEPLGQERRLTIADNTVFHSQEMASHIHLPVVPIDETDH